MELPTTELLYDGSEEGQDADADGDADGDGDCDGDLGEHWLKETKYYWEHYKDLKKPGTCTDNGFFGIEEAVKVIKDCEERYKKEIDPKLVN